MPFGRFVSSDPVNEYVRLRSERSPSTKYMSVGLAETKYPFVSLPAPGLRVNVAPVCRVIDGTRSFAALGELHAMTAPQTAANRNKVEVGVPTVSRS